MDNITRRQLLELTKQAQQQGFKGSVVDVYNNPQILQQQVEVANTPQQQQQGLRGRTPQDAPGAMVFPNVPPNTSMTTKGMQFPVDMDMYDKRGHLMQSYKNVPPGVESLPTGPRGATVIERPSLQTGGVKKDQSKELTWANRPENADMGWYEEYVNQSLGNPMGRADATATPGDLYDREKHALAAYYTARKIGPAGAMASGTAHEATQFGDWRSFIGDTVNNLVGSSIGGATRFLPESWGEKAIKTISPYLPAGDSPKFPSHQRTTPYQTGGRVKAQTGRPSKKLQSAYIPGLGTAPPSYDLYEGLGTSTRQDKTAVAPSVLPDFSEKAVKQRLAAEGINVLPSDSLEISTLSDKSYDKLPVNERQVYDAFYGSQTLPYEVQTGIPEGRTMSKIRKKDNIHWEDALRMTRDSGVAGIYNEPSYSARKNPEKFNIKKGSRDFRAHANLYSGEIFIPPFQTFQQKYPNWAATNPRWDSTMSKYGYDDNFSSWDEVQAYESGSAYISNLTAELAHLNLEKQVNKEGEAFFQRYNIPFRETPDYSTLMNVSDDSRAEREKEEGKYPDSSNYRTIGDYEYHTHYDPEGAEARMFREYNLKNRLFNSTDTRRSGGPTYNRITMQTGGVHTTQRFAGDPWEYKFDNGKFLTRRIGTDRWLTAKGKPLEAIRSKVYQLPATGTQMPGESIPVETQTPAPTQRGREVEVSEEPLGPFQPPGTRPDTRRVDRPAEEAVIPQAPIQTLPQVPERPRAQVELPVPPELNLDPTQQQDNTRTGNIPTSPEAAVPESSRIQDDPEYQDVQAKLRELEQNQLEQLYEENRQAIEAASSEEDSDDGEERGMFDKLSDWFSDKANQLQYYLEREGYIDPVAGGDLQVVEENIEAPVQEEPVAPETPKDYFISPQTHMTDNDGDYKNPFTGRYNTDYKYWGFRYQNSNDKGLDYIPGSRGDTGKTYEGVGGVGHFLIEADLTDGYKTTQTTNKIRKDMAGEGYVPFYKKLANGRVNIRYGKGQSEYSDLNGKGYKTFAALRTLNLSDIAWDKTARPYSSVEAAKKDNYARTGANSNSSVPGMYGPKILNILTKDGKDTWMVFKNIYGRNSKGKKFGRFNGNSVVFIVETPEGRIIRDYSGTVQNIENESKRITKEFGIDDSKVTLGFYDSGSYSAKPMADADGVLRSRNWSSFNTDNNSGASLLIPRTFKTGGIKKKYLTRRLRQTGGASRADSLAVASNAQDVKDYYDSTGKYRALYSNPVLSWKDSLAEMDSIATTVNAGYVPGGVYDDPSYWEGWGFGGGAWDSLDHKRQEYRQDINETTGLRQDFNPSNPTNTFEQRDLHHRQADSRAPSTLFDRRIAPQSITEIVNVDPTDAMYDDHSRQYQYDPLAVTPWDMLTDKQKDKRIDKYGTSGTPYADPKYTKTKTKKPQTPTQRAMQSIAYQVPWGFAGSSTRYRSPEPLESLKPQREEPQLQQRPQVPGYRRTRAPQTVYDVKGTSRTGRMPDYEAYWSPESKSWKTREIDSEKLDEYREENIPKRRRRETRASFQSGGYKQLPKY